METIIIGIALVTVALVVVIMMFKKHLRYHERKKIKHKTKRIMASHYDSQTIQQMHNIKPRLKALLKRHKKPEHVRQHVKQHGLGELFSGLYKVFLTEIFIEMVLATDTCFSKKVQKNNIIPHNNWRRRYLTATVPLRHIVDVVYHIRKNPELGHNQLVNTGWDKALVERVHSVLKQGEIDETIPKDSPGGQ